MGKKYYYITVMCLVVFALYLTGCGLANSRILEKSYKTDREMASYLGEVMISEIQGVKNDVYNMYLPGTIRWELVYSGKTSNSIKIYYREYVVSDGSWLAKDAFTQELNYDLSSSNLIRYKSVQMEVISADNQQIVFKVISDKTQPANGKNSN